MSFLNSTYLWALLGLLVPIAIHLWSKKEGKTIKVGSIELLRESESKQTSSIKPNELWLLLFRMFIIALVTIVLAEPIVKLKSDNAEITYLIEPSLLNHEKTSNILNSIDNASNIRLLHRNFPVLDDIDLENLTTQTPNYWQLAKDMQSLASDSIVVYTRALASGFIGIRPAIDKNIEWIIIDTEEIAINIPLKATRINTNIELLSMHSNDKNTSFEKILINESDYNITELEIIPDTPVKILLYFEDSFSNDSRFIEASLRAASKHINRIFDITKAQDISNLNIETYNLVIWLAENSQFPNEIIKSLEFRPDNISKSLISKGWTKNQFYLTEHLNTENSIENYLPEQLLNILDLNSDLDSIINENDKRAFSKAELLPTVLETKTQNKNTNYLSISKWLWLILGISLFGERLLANYRKQ